ncbi:MAG: hypothetical protein J0H34_05805 [Rhizobiales bacterium]|nr:hypothetical protein [Hyphomicrobiales bacterium]
MVAVVQPAIIPGAVGGVLFDLGGYRATSTAGAILLPIAASLALLTSRREPA